MIFVETIGLYRRKSVYLCVDVDYIHSLFIYEKLVIQIRDKSYGNKPVPIRQFITFHTYFFRNEKTGVIRNGHNSSTKL